MTLVSTKVILPHTSLGSHCLLTAAFAEEDDLDGFQYDTDFQKEGHKTD